MAWKFKPARAETILQSVEFSVGRQGSITPTAHFNPVYLAGAKISRATLHNFDEIERLGIMVGDSIVVERSGEVIPKVVDVLKQKRPAGAKPVIPPEICPVCGSGVVQTMGEVAYRCVNSSCPAQIKGGIRHFVSRNAFNIEGLGEEIVNRLYELGFIKNFSDLFNLKNRREELIELERFGEKSVDNLLNSIDKSKRIDYWRFLNSLGIGFVGEETARLLSMNFQPVEKLEETGEEELIRIDGIGEAVAESIHSYFLNNENRILIQSLVRSGIEIHYPKISSSVESAISGKRVVFTGRADGFSREEFSELVRTNGGIPSDSVSKNTDFLVAGENAGSKLEKARELGIKIITDKEFLDMLKK